MQRKWEYTSSHLYGIDPLELDKQFIMYILRYLPLFSSRSRLSTLLFLLFFPIGCPVIMPILLLLETLLQPEGLRAKYPRSSSCWLVAIGVLLATGLILMLPMFAKFSLLLEPVRLRLCD